MLGFLWTIIAYFLWFLVYCVKFICYLFFVLLLLLWKHQGAILYQRHAPSRKRQLAYNPFPRVRSPSHYQLDYDDFFVTTRDRVQIHCWLIRQQNSTECPTMVCFHGNAGNIGYRLPSAYFMFRELRANIVMVDYRGYGNSEGVPTEKGLSYDAESVLAHLLERNDINLDKVFLFGRSLGGAVAIDLAWRCCTGKLMTLDNDKILVNDTDTEHRGAMDSAANNEAVATNDAVTSHLNGPTDDELTRLNRAHRERKMVVAGLIIENTFTSILDMVFVIIGEFLQSRQGEEQQREHDVASELLSGPSKTAKCMRCLRLFLKYFITNNWDSHSKVGDIRMPSLYLSGLSDELIPPNQMQSLFRRAQQHSILPVLQTFAEGDHNSTWQRAGQQYWDHIVAFVTTTSAMAEQRRSM